MSFKVGGSVLALAFVVGCAGKATSPATSASPAASVEAVVGQYALIAIDGRALPFALRGAPDRPVTSGSLVLNTNGTFRIQTTYAASSSGPNSQASFDGACYAEGGEVKMVWDGASATNLMVRGDTVLLKRDGAQYSYLRNR